MSELKEKMEVEIKATYKKGFTDGAKTFQLTIATLKEKGATDSQIVEVLQSKQIIKDLKKLGI